MAQLQIAAVAAATLLTLSTAPRPAAADWKTVVTESQESVNAESTATDGRTILRMSCSATPGPGVPSGLLVTFEGYAGRALERNEDLKRPVVFTVTQPGGAPRAFRLSVHHFQPDNAWVWDRPMPPAFLDAFGDGVRLTISNLKGDRAAEFSLKGAAAVRDTMKRVCGLGSASPEQGAQAAPAPGGSDEGCKLVQFAAGQSSAVLQGIAPAETMLCYLMTTASGQTASVKVTSGKNVIITIIGVGDARDSFQFRTERKTYKIMVGQLMRSVTEQPFTISVSVK
jgi:hypothetical protein